jgi:thioredoxin 1
MKKIIPIFIFVSIVFSLMFLYTAQEQARETDLEPLPKIPADGMVTMVNLGAESCVPCRMMQPILRELQVEYEDQVAIPFIDVSKYKDQGPRFRITAIPTQIFYDHLGQEAFRHSGFLEKRAVVEILEELLKKQASFSTEAPT